MKKRNHKTNTAKPPRTMAAAGVNYNVLDPAKRLGQRYAIETVEPFLNSGCSLHAVPLEEFRGESAYVFRLPSGDYVAHIEEGLGTMNLVAEALYVATGDVSGYEAAGTGAAEAILNDIATTGVPPISLQLHFGVGDDKYLKDTRRLKAFYRGWKSACIESGLIWTGGEMPALKKIIVPGTAEISGSAMGWLSGHHEPIVQRIQAGDRLIALGSSGIQTNGWTQVRTTGEAQPDGGVSLFKQALVPSIIYVNAVRAMIKEHLRPNYAIHVSGHGWRKLMRAKADLTYVIEHMPPVPAIFHRLQKLARISTMEMYRNYNMGIGFVLIVDPKDAQQTLLACRKAGYRAWDIGFVKKGRRKVRIQPLRITLPENDLNIR